MRAGLVVAGVACLLVGLFYAFNAYIQYAERGFAETLDVPIALIGIAVGLFLLWVARRPASLTPPS